jgi:hypothetical protein
LEEMALAGLDQGAWDEASSRSIALYDHCDKIRRVRPDSRGRPGQRVDRSRRVD